MKSFRPSLTLPRVGSVAALLAALTALLGGCDGGQSGAEVAAGGSGDDWMPGYECQTDDTCREGALYQLGLLGAPMPDSFELHNASCQLHRVQLADREVLGYACACARTNTTAVPGAAPVQQSYLLGPTGVGCSVTGRGGDCLWSDDDVTGCTGMADSGSCDASCAELAERLNADAERSFQTELLYAGCEQGTCKNVISIDDECYASFPGNLSLPDQQVKSHDCGLGAAAILEAESDAWMPRESRGPMRQDASYHEPNSSSTVRLTVSRDHWGTARGKLGFSVSAQFYEPLAADIHYGKEIDPFEGFGDCRVWQTSPNGAGPLPQLRSVDRAVLRDGDREWALQELHPSSDSYSYQLDLAAAGVEPRFDAPAYGFSASGGSFGGDVEFPSLRLPNMISSPELEGKSQFERGALALTWQGEGANAVQLSFDIRPQLGEASVAYHVECSSPDSPGAFTVPAEVLELVPDGFVTATLRRAYPILGSTTYAVAEALTRHHFVLGPTCDGSALMAACQRSANTIRARYQECADPEPPPIEQLCPDYLATSCGSCAEYFDCLAASTTCGSDGLTTRAGCGCP